MIDWRSWKVTQTLQLCVWESKCRYLPDHLNARKTFYNNYLLRAFTVSFLLCWMEEQLSCCPGSLSEEGFLSLQTIQGTLRSYVPKSGARTALVHRVTHLHPQPRQPFCHLKQSALSQAGLFHALAAFCIQLKPMWATWIWQKVPYNCCLTQPAGRPKIALSCWYTTLVLQ